MEVSFDKIRMTFVLSLHALPLREINTKVLFSLFACEEL